ncbi:MAG: PAS domain-containing protein [Bermanella sp.]
MIKEDSIDFINNSSIGIHTVSAEGIIEYANQFELNSLGYAEDEYVGHHVSKFQMDKSALKEMMQRLGDFEILKNYPAKVQAKDEIKYILYNSSVYVKDGEFIHTRCYGVEIASQVYDIFYKLLQAKS